MLYNRGIDKRKDKQSMSRIETILINASIAVLVFALIAGHVMKNGGL